MKPEQQRIKIAEACGWKQVSSNAPLLREGVLYGVRECNVERQKWERIPDYLNDLDAMHKAELSLGLNYHQWTRELNQVCDRECKCMESAPATLRAEAFLKTLGLWEDDIPANDKVSHDAPPQ